MRKIRMILLPIIFCLTIILPSANVGGEEASVLCEKSVTSRTVILETMNSEEDEQYIPKGEEYTEEELAELDYYDSLEYIAMCVESEAGNQGYMGKVYVTDCILNLYDSGDYDNFYDCINYPNRFSVVSNGSIDCIPSEETYEIVAKEIENRTNSEIRFFRTDHYHDFGTPCFRYREHYFSK